ncbi:MAG: SCO family protein [Pseudomonadota bacterium]
MTSGRTGRWLLSGLGAAAALVAVLAVSGAGLADRSDLPRMGQAADFTLTDQAGMDVALSDHQGKIVLVNFMFTKCPDYCPTLTAVLGNVQADLIAEGLGDRVHFLSVTVDPENDTPELLQRYSEAMHVDMDAWHFLTGAPAQIDRVAGAYGVFFERLPSGSVQHNLLTTVIDKDGQMRVQYSGERFDPDELLADIRSLAKRRLSLL